MGIPQENREDFVKGLPLPMQKPKREPAYIMEPVMIMFITRMQKC